MNTKQMLINLCSFLVVFFVGVLAGYYSFINEYEPKINTIILKNEELEKLNKDMEVYVKDAEMNMSEVFVASMELTDKLKKCEKRNKKWK